MDLKTNPNALIDFKLGFLKLKHRPAVEEKPDARERARLKVAALAALGWVLPGHLKILLGYNTLRGNKTKPLDVFTSAEGASENSSN